MTTFKRIALTLVIIGAINWGLIGFFNFDLVATLFGGQASALSRIIYALVGLSGLYSLSILFISDERTSYDNGYRNRTGSLNYNTEFADEDEFVNEDDKNINR